MLSSTAARELALVVAAAVAACTPCDADVIAHPNQIRGTFRLTNSNPDVLRALPAAGLTDLRVVATSRPPAPPLEASASGLIVDRLRASYEVTVEGGLPGIAYDVIVQPTGVACGCDPQVSDPVEPEPAPDSIRDFEACAGVVHLTLWDALGAPVVPQDGLVFGGLDGVVTRGTNEAWLHTCRVDVPLPMTLSYSTGQDPLHDTLNHSVDLPDVQVACDEIVEVRAVVPTGDCPGDQLGRVVGRLDVLGVDLIHRGWASHGMEAATSLLWAQGPHGNSRLDVIEADPSNGPFELENLVPSDASWQRWLIRGRTALSLDGREESFDAALATVAVEAGATVDLDDFFVVDPTQVVGDVAIAGPPASGRRWGPMLGAPASLRASAVGSGTVASGARHSARQAHAAIDAGTAYDDATATLVAGYRLIVGGPHGERSYWNAGFAVARFETRDDSGDATRWYDATMALDESVGAADLAVPGATITREHSACVGQVLLRFHSADAPFHSPALDGTSRLDGPDYRGVVRDRGLHLTSSGVPVDAPRAALDGAVAFLAPEGDVTLDPRATFLNPGGGESLTDLLPVAFHVGCRQILDGMPQIVTQILRAPDCAGALPVNVSGRVDGEAEVASITYSANGGPEIDACRPCGPNPTYSIDVVPTSGELEVVVTATDVEGRVASASSIAGFAQEPSAGDVDAGAEPLRVARGASASEVIVTWQDAVGLSDVLYAGTIASLWERRAYDHASFGACDLDSPRWTGELPAGSVYLLATTACEYGNASLGRDSFGTEIPGATPRCP